MKLMFDFLPIVVFFIAYKFFGIFTATATVIVISLLQVLIYWLKYRRVEKMLLATSALVAILGSITLILHNDIFIKWKPTVIYGLFALSFLISQFFGKKPIVQRMLEDSLQLPDKVWSKLNLSWVAFFSFMGAINIYVVYHFSTDVWVNFKLIGIIGFTLVFVILQAIFLSRYIQPENKIKSPTIKEKK